MKLLQNNFQIPLLNKDQIDSKYLDDLETNQFCILKVDSYDDVKDICSELGNVIHENDVVTQTTSRSLSNSYNALDFHTDHHRATLIGLYCVRQSTFGGETRLIHLSELLKFFSQEEIEIMQNTYLHEHRIFENDPENFPMLEGRDGEYNVYYSYWLAKKNITEKQQNILKKFKELTHSIKPIELKLKPKELLLFYNRKILHSRTEIREGEDRLLKRIWIETNN